MQKPISAPGNHGLFARERLDGGNKINMVVEFHHRHGSWSNGSFIPHLAKRKCHSLDKPLGCHRHRRLPAVGEIHMNKFVRESRVPWEKSREVFQCQCRLGQWNGLQIWYKALASIKGQMHVLDPSSETTIPRQESLCSRSNEATIPGSKMGFALECGECTTL